MTPQEAARAIVALLDYPGVTISLDAGSEEARQLMAEVKRIREV